MYQVRISTDAYRKQRCSQKNWEKGTINDFMEAINGWQTKEKTLKQVAWRIDLFSGIWHFEEEGWEDWYKQPINKITYLDKLCGFERTQEVSPYGFKQGYFDRDKVLKKLQENGIVRIPFAWVYDVRQYDKHMDGCYMEIVKIKETSHEILGGTKMNYRIEDLKLLNMKKLPVYQSNPYMRNGLYVFEIEKDMSLEEKITFIDTLKDGVATYLLNLLTKWEKEKDTLPKDNYGYPKTVSKKAWIRRNDKREIINIEYDIGTYYLFKTKFLEMTTTCPSTEYGYHLEYTGNHIVHQWFHDLLKQLAQEERKYFKKHDPFQIKLKKVKDYGNQYREYFDCLELNDIIWNNKEDVPEEHLDKYIAAYQRLEAEIKRISQELHAL